MILRKVREKCQRSLRSFLGIEQILLAQKKIILSLGNGAKSFFSEPEKVRSSAPYQRCAEIISLLTPMDIQGAKFVRVGKNYDGGYVMLDDFQRKVDAAYSFGIGRDVSWDKTMADRGIDVFMYDHTIARSPQPHPKFHYFRVGITGFKKRSDLKTLGELVAQNGHAALKNLILKMDVEGCEWDVFKEASPSVIAQFSQIVVEFHGLTGFDPGKHAMILEVLGKIHRTHQSVHVHANVSETPCWIGDLVLPPILEVAYVRRDDFKDRWVKNTRQFPTEIDQPTFKNWPDIYLGDFAAEGKIEKQS